MVIMETDSWKLPGSRYYYFSVVVRYSRQIVVIQCWHLSENGRQSLAVRGCGVVSTPSLRPIRPTKSDWFLRVPGEHRQPTSASFSAHDERLTAVWNSLLCPGTATPSDKGRRTLGIYLTWKSYRRNQIKTRNTLDCDQIDQSNYSLRIVFYHILTELAPTRNSAIRSADHENPTLEPNMEWIGWRVAEISPFEIFPNERSVVNLHWYQYYTPLLFAMLGM